MPFGTAGSHLYVLDSLVDGLGNLRTLTPTQSQRKGAPASDASDASPQSVNAVRLATVVRNAAMSFRDCSPGNPASLLIDSEVKLAVIARQSDPRDGPWQVTVKYEPEGSNASGKRKSSKPWTKSLATLEGKAELLIVADAPGQYSITDVKGRFCSGDVLSPESCRVVRVCFIVIWSLRTVVLNRDRLSSRTQKLMLNGNEYTNGEALIEYTHYCV